MRLAHHSRISAHDGVDTVLSGSSGVVPLCYGISVLQSHHDNQRHRNRKTEQAPCLGRTSWQRPFAQARGRTRTASSHPADQDNCSRRAMDTAAATTIAPAVIRARVTRLPRSALWCARSNRVQYPADRIQKAFGLVQTALHPLHPYIELAGCHPICSM